MLYTIGIINSNIPYLQQDTTLVLISHLQTLQSCWASIKCGNLAKIRKFPNKCVAYMHEYICCACTWLLYTIYNVIMCACVWVCVFGNKFALRWRCNASHAQFARNIKQFADKWIHTHIQRQLQLQLQLHIVEIQLQIHSRDTDAQICLAASDNVQIFRKNPNRNWWLLLPQRRRQRQQQYWVSVCVWVWGVCVGVH